VRQTLAVNPGHRELARGLGAYAGDLVVHSQTSYHLAPEVVARLREYERAGCDRVMLQHLLHTDLEPVRLLGRELAPALA